MKMVTLTSLFFKAFCSLFIFYLTAPSSARPKRTHNKQNKTTNPIKPKRTHYVGLLTNDL